MSRSTKSGKQRGLAFRLTVFILSATTIIFLAAFGYNYYQSRALVLKNVKEVAMCHARAMVLAIEKKLSTAEDFPKVAARRLEASGNDCNDFLLFVRDIIAQIPEIFGFAVAYEPYGRNPEKKFYAPYFYTEDQGKVAFTQLGRQIYNYSLHDWYLIPRELDRPVWSEPYFDEGGGGILMATYSCPFYEFFGQSRQFAGVITADISLEDLVAQINELAFYETGFAFLISRNGAFLAHPDREQIMRESIFSMAAARDLPQLRKVG